MKTINFEQYKKILIDFKDEILLPNERYVEENDKIPLFIIDKMKELGLFGLTIPEKYGGKGLCTKEIIEILFIMGQTLPAFQAIWGTNIGIGSKALLRFGSEEQRMK